MSTPNQERIRLLVTALRSKKYRQTKGKLARYDRKARKRKFCCLGVACEIAKENGLDVVVEWDSISDDTYSYNGSTETLPMGIMRWYGFRETNPTVRYPDGDRINISLAQLNDDRNLSFREIADVLEQNFLQDGGADNVADV